MRNSSFPFVGETVRPGVSVNNAMTGWRPEGSYWIMKNMKRWILIGVVLCLASPVFAADVEKPEVEVIDEIVAKVNGAIITRTDLEQQRQNTLKDLKRRQMSDDEIEKIMKSLEPNILRDRIDNLLLTQRGKQLDISVDQEVSKYLADLMLQFKIADQDKFAQVVSEQTGMRFEDYKEDVTNGILTQRVLGMEIGSKIVIPKEEIVKYYEEHKNEFMREERVFLREILISTEGKTDEEIAELEKKAQEIADNARGGGRFEDLAREHSDAVTAESGGDLGGWKKGDLRKEIEEKVWNAERNHVTDPIRVSNGFLILKVLAHHSAGLALLEEVENEITGRLYGPKFDPMVREYLTELRQQAYLEIKDGYVDSAAAPGKDTTWTDPAKLIPETVTKEQVINRPGHKRLLWVFPVPGTERGPISVSK